MRGCGFMQKFENDNESEYTEDGEARVWRRPVSTRRSVAWEASINALMLSRISWLVSEQRLGEQTICRLRTHHHYLSIRASAHPQEP